VVLFIIIKQIYRFLGWNVEGNLKPGLSSRLLGFPGYFYF